MKFTAIPEWMRKLDLFIRWIVWTCCSFWTLDWILSVHHHSHRYETWNIVYIFDICPSTVLTIPYLEPWQWWVWEGSLVLGHLTRRWSLIPEQRRRLSGWSWVSWGTNWWRYPGRHYLGLMLTPGGGSVRTERRRRRHWSGHPGNSSVQPIRHWLDLKCRLYLGSQQKSIAKYGIEIHKYILNHDVNVRSVTLDQILIVDSSNDRT